MIASYATMTSINMLISGTHVLDRAMDMASPYYQNSTAFSQAVIKNAMVFMRKVLFDHTTNDWREVIRKSINIPTAIFPAKTAIGYRASVG
jgi:non-heme chloroperoxidase